MKTISITLIACLLAGSAFAYPIEIRVSGIVDTGRVIIPPGEFPGDLMDIAGLPYTATFFADTDSPDHHGSPSVGTFWDSLSVRVEIGTLGRQEFSAPDAISKVDDGHSAELSSYWALGLEGLLSIHAPTGSFGDPNKLLPFAPLQVTSPSDAIVALGGWVDDFWPKGGNSVWFESKCSSENPVEVSSVRVPDGGATLWQFGIAVLAILYGIRLHHRWGSRRG